MRPINLILTITLILLFKISFVPADILTTSPCTVTAEVIDINYETRRLNAGGTSSYHYAKLKVLTTLSGNCSFIKADDIFKTSGGTDPKFLTVGQTIKAGVEPDSVMGSAGVVNFIQWEPITIINENGESQLPEGFHLQSSNKTENPIITDKSYYPCQQDSDCVSRSSYVEPRDGQPEKTLLICRHKDEPLKNEESTLGLGANVPDACACDSQTKQCKIK